MRARFLSFLARPPRATAGAACLRLLIRADVRFVCSGAIDPAAVTILSALLGRVAGADCQELMRS
jgi:hypothetical protein